MLKSDAKVNSYLPPEVHVTEIDARKILCQSSMRMYELDWGDAGFGEE